MVRELAINLYLFVFRIIFNLLKSFPQKKKTTFVASFGDNILYTLNELEKQVDDHVVILKSSQCKMDFGSDRLVLDFQTFNLINWIRSIYHLATSQRVIVDNYYGFLAVAKFNPNAQCIQLWHATGAVKQFGLNDPSIQKRSSRAYKRFKDVYHRFDYVVVGSEQMASIFKQSFDLSEDNILRTGIPRSDFFFDENAKKEVEKSLILEYPIINEKKVILYAPTYRDEQLKVAEIKLNIDKLYKRLKEDYVLFLRLHPAVNDKFQNKYPGFIINVSGYHNINHLLVITDILVTDYSSVPFEFSLLNKPMVFFAYDLDDYAITRGFYNHYEDLVPGPVVENTEDLIDVISNEIYNLERIKMFANQWNQYSVGNSSERLINTLFHKEGEYKVVNQM